MNVRLVLLASVGWFALGAVPALAQTACTPGDLAKHLDTIRTSRAEAQVKLAAECAVRLSPSAETLGLLESRLDRTLQQIRALSPRIPPIREARIAAALAEALYASKASEGFEKIAAYFAGADWSTHRDQSFFNILDAEVEDKSPLAEVYYLALTRLPLSAGFPVGQACRVVRDSLGLSVASQEPRFVHGVLAALARIERVTAFPDRDLVVLNCEAALQSLLLGDGARDAFLASYRDRLSPGERQILDRFLAKIVPEPKDVAERLAAAFFAVPWRTSLADWQKRNPGVPCEPFRGTSAVVGVDDLWCTRCSSQAEGGELHVHFYPDATGKACTLQKVRFSQPTTVWETLPVLAERLDAGMGSGRQAGEVHDRGSAHWSDVRRWRWKGVEVLAFRNLGFGGDEVPLVEILARDYALRKTMELEEAAERVVEEGRRLREQARTARLHRDVAKSLPDLIRRLEAAREGEARYRVLLELLSRMAPTGPHRAAQLYLADRLADGLVHPTVGTGHLKDWEAKGRLLATHGIAYTPGIDGLFYNHVFRKKIIDEGLAGYWAEEAFLDWRLAGWTTGGPCTETDLFGQVIAGGEAFLTRNPGSRIRKPVLLSLAQAHETGWSLSLADPMDEYVEAASYQAEAAEHRRKAIAYYEEFLQSDPDSSEAILARPKLVRLRLGVDTAAREFYCIYD